MQVGLLVDGEQLGAALDPVQTGLVHIERAQHRLASLTRLLNRDGGTVSIASRNCDDTVNRIILDHLGLDRLGHGGRVAK